MRSARRPALGAMLLALILAAVLIGPAVWSAAPGAMDLGARNAAPDWAHPLGRDQLGRDFLARLLTGGRISLAVAAAAALMGTVIGAAVGAAAGMSRRLDAPLMWLTDIFLCVPLLPLLLIAATLFRAPLAAALGPQMGVFALVTVAIGASSWMGTARILRAEVRSVMQRDFIAAARLAGRRPAGMIAHHVLPNVAASLSVSASLAAASAILTESALSFLGLGFPPDLPTWGRLIFEGTPQLGQYPGRALWPGALITLSAVGIMALGDTLRDLAGPK
ncbi:peptide ABC transporter [Pelagivirga sediminicola]|uniref:Peptide ABC transporter n=1 Tax=Pelagivirga sediminicola TaxID=2170575 RepID=A0A2T7GBU4_9RHOB|nr:ABC transporter permease [Pelagivirga sediminicola]PVA11887.1 peptide ABC transporter [Pelagivirga sediminicola]